MRYAATLAPHVIQPVTPRPPTLFGPMPQEKIRTALRDMQLDPDLRAQIRQSRSEPLPDDSPPRTAEASTSGSNAQLGNFINLDTPTRSDQRVQAPQAPAIATLPATPEQQHTAVEQLHVGAVSQAFSWNSQMLVERMIRNPIFSCQDVGISTTQVWQAFGHVAGEVNNSDIARAGFAELTPPEVEAPLVAIRRGSSRPANDESLHLRPNRSCSNALNVD